MGKQDIKYDQNNYRCHDERNLALIKKSIQRCGACRSILLDKNGEIIAGNATYKTLQELGIPVKIIPTDGKTAYKRYTERKKPQDLIKKFNLDTPIYAHLCREGLFSGI